MIHTLAIVIVLILLIVLIVAGFFCVLTEQSAGDLFGILLGIACLIIIFMAL